MYMYSVHSQGEENRVDYPNWAQFIGCVIVLSSVLCMPIFLIVRLIFFESGRQEALVFFRQQINDGEKLMSNVKLLPGRTISFFRSLKLRAQSWQLHQNYEAAEDTSVPYSRANGSPDPILTTYGTNADNTD